MTHSLCNNNHLCNKSPIGDYEKKEEVRERGNKREGKEDRTRTKEEKISYLCGTFIL